MTSTGDQHSDENASASPSPGNTGLAAGTILNNRYLIERELGRGGIGAVYLARDKQLVSRLVVIKVLLESSLQNSWFVSKFRHEIDALTRVDHPNIVGIFDAGEMEAGQPYIVMQYVEGANLRSSISVSGMGLSRVARLFRQIGRALSAAHEKGIFHRDLKPENIMLQRLSDGDEQVKIIDFGIAKVKNSLVAPTTSTNLTVGTVMYMSPEQLERKAVTAASDIYALGVIAYEMVTGRRPFNPESSFQLLELQRAGVRVEPQALRPNLPADAGQAILKALCFNPLDRYRRAQDFGDALWRALNIEDSAGDIIHSVPAPDDSSQISTLPLSVRGDSGGKSAPKRIALLYKRHAQPDEQILSMLEAELRERGYEVFIDRHLSIGVEWAQEIERQVRSADAVIPLLSTASVSSEMLTYEILTANDAAQKQKGKPRLLPVRVNFEGLLPDALAAVLNPLQYAIWNSPQDNQRLVQDLLNSLENPPNQPLDVRKLEPIGGAVPLDSKFYIVRPTDDEFLAAIERRDSIVLVKGARQMGKTSLLARGLKLARETGAKVVLTDFQGLNEAHFESVETLYLALAELIADQLDLDVLPQEVWNAERGPSVNFQRYLRREVLPKISGPMVWGLDEVDRLFTCHFGSEVFGLFRSWHNARSLDPEGPWRNLTMAIAYATEAHLFISDLNQSPFNVGTRLTLDDFTPGQMAELNRRYNSPLKDQIEINTFYALVSGHPYLVRKGLHEMAAHGTSVADFSQQADRDEGPLGDHLRRFLVLLAQDASLCDMMREILRRRPCPSTESFYRLRSAGLLAGDSVQEARPRCQLYANYLARHLL
ncbi:MAG: AAA-like domain-containing protein [Pyrinomonadaceae bacterium]|nr:AAA-like domain-containing protein [Pyrinomonadaceae bacterium]